MALKPGTIKALFGKLATNADDVAMYGDDVVDVARPYLDDVYDDTSRLLKYYNDNAKWNPHPHIYGKYVDSPVLQNALQSKEYFIGGTPVANDAESGVLKKATDYLLHGTGSLPVGAQRTDIVDSLGKAVDAAPEIGSPARTVSFWGDAMLDDYADDTMRYLRGYDTVDVPEMPTNQLAFDWDEGDLTIRPHKGNRGMYALYQKLLNKG